MDRARDPTAAADADAEPLGAHLEVRPSARERVARSREAASTDILEKTRQRVNVGHESVPVRDAFHGGGRERASGEGVPARNLIEAPRKVTDVTVSAQESGHAWLDRLGVAADRARDYRHAAHNCFHGGKSQGLGPQRGGHERPGVLEVRLDVGVARPSR